MRKAIKIALMIIGVIIGVTLSASIVVAVFLPGLPYYLLARSCANINTVMQNFDRYPNSQPVNGQSVSTDTFTVQLPKTCVITKSSNSIICYQDVNADFTVMLNQKSDEGYNLITSISQETKIDIDEIQTWYQDTFGFCPENSFEYNKLLYTLNIYNFDITDKKSSVLCYAMAMQKDFCPSGDYYLYERDDVKGFLIKKNKLLVFQFYDESDLDKQYQLTIHTNDADLACSIINSVKFDG